MTQTTHPTTAGFRLSIAEILRGMDLGLVTHNVGGFTIADRNCTDCNVSLPKCTADGVLDTFPRCSAHAF